MNIALAVHNYDPGSGTGGYVVELSRRLAQRHDVTVYAATWKEPVPGVRMIRVPALRGSAYATMLSFPAAFAAVRGRHDIVHTQGWQGGGDVVTAHIVLAAWRNAARIAGIAAPPGERLLGGFVAAREGAAVRNARAVIAPSRRAADDIARWYGRSDVAVIPHGFPALPPLPDRTGARRSLGLPPDGFIAACIGDARKAFLPAARALASVPNVHLLVASESPSAPWMAEARALGVADRVHWAGVLPVARALAAADVLVHPTIYDTFAMVVAEACAAGVPAIVSPQAGITDLLEDGRSALIVDTAEQLAAALTRLRDDPAERRRLGEAGRAIAASRTWDRVTAETEALYIRVRPLSSVG